MLVKGRHGEIVGDPPTHEVQAGEQARCVGGQGHRRDAFTVHVEEGTTHQWPITDQASSINNIMTPAMDAVFSGQAEPASLTDANEQVNALIGG